MSSWTPKQLDSVRNHDDFTIAPDRDHQGAPGRLIWVWAVEVDGDIFVRSANPTSRWFASAATFQRGSAFIADQTEPVSIAVVDDDELRDQVDEAFRRKYAHDPYFSEDVLTGSRQQIARLRPA